MDQPPERARRTDDLVKAVQALRWAPGYFWQRLVRRPGDPRGRHLILAVADHFEPSYVPGVREGRAPRAEQQRRLDTWCREYPKMASAWRDGDGYPFRHTYFYPAEQYDRTLVQQLAEHCHAGWGETEIHLHHGVDRPDTADDTRRALVDFRDRLVNHGCLSAQEGETVARYAFVHGNWALANSLGGAYCGVDEELAILTDTGCYADFTLPSAPSPAQIAKINALYEPGQPLTRRAPHRRGRDVERGQPPTTLPLIIQGPLAMTFRRSGRPRIENGEISTGNPATVERLRLWYGAGIGVKGLADWVFVKLHCHGMDPGDRDAMLGESMTRFLQAVTRRLPQEWGIKVHFVTAREMMNIVLAACDGREGDPGAYRDYRLRLLTPPRVEW